MKILTFDIEDWFHILDNSNTQSVSSWSKFESRIEKNMYTIFEIIENANVSATFFVLGWIANKYPHIIRNISKKGYEIGSHTHMHQLVYNQSKKSFYNDVEKSIKTIEDCVGKKVKSFRAPGFSITKQNKWAFEVLHSLGIERDSSVFPAHRGHGGFPSYTKSTPSILSYEGLKIKEFPINTYNFFGKKIVFSGGGYFRLCPYYLIKSWAKRSSYVMTYFHPRDFDPNQPLIPGLSLKRKFKSYVGLKKSKYKLQKWLDDFDFIDLETANKRILWDKSSVVEI